MSGPVSFDLFLKFPSINLLRLMTKMDILESKCYNSVEEGVIVEE